MTEAEERKRLLDAVRERAHASPALERPCRCGAVAHMEHARTLTSPREPICFACFARMVRGG